MDLVSIAKLQGNTKGTVEIRKNQEGGAAVGVKTAQEKGRGRKGFAMEKELAVPPGSRTKKSRI